MMHRISGWAILWIALSCFQFKAQNCTATWNVSNVTCNGGNDGSISVFPTGGVPPYTMFWSNGVVGLNLLNLPAGCYQGTLMDAANCNTSITVCLTQPNPLTVNIVPNGNNLVAVATGGTPPYSYSWPNWGFTTSQITPNTPGIYTVVVVDANGCTVTATTNWSQMVYNTTFNGTVSLDCDQDGTVDSTLQNVPLVFNENGSLYYGTLINNTLTLGLSNTGYYTLAVDNGWLANHGYQVQSINPNPIQVTPGGTYTFQMSLVCDTSATNLGLSGVVFCDANNNGIQEVGEMPISNALILGQMLGTQGQVYTNANGAYTLNLFGNPVDSVLVSVAPNFIQYNGLPAPQTFQQNVGGWNMSNPQTLNIGLQCNYNGCITNSFQGYVYCDANSNNMFDSGENPMINAPVTLVGSNGTITVFTDSTGMYNYTGAISNSNSVYAYINAPYLTNYGFPSVPGQNIVGALSNPNAYNFPVNCTPCTNLSTFLSHSGTYFQGQQINVYLYWNAAGPSPCSSYSLKLKHPSNVTPVVNNITLPNFSQVGDTLVWVLNNVSGYQSAVIPFLLPSGLTGNLNQVYEGFITPNCNVVDCQMNNNYFALNRTLGNSYDPNQKTVVRPSSTSLLLANVGEEFIDGNSQEILTYTIEFQNTGTAPAQDIYIIDTLENLLDVSTFDVFDRSHTMQTTFIGDHVVRFDFPQIWLPDSNSNEPESHGFVRFRIQEAPVLVLPTYDTLRNTGYIFFDWNDAIVTNTTMNINTTINALSGSEELALKLYPNPGNDELTLECKGPFQYKIFDLSGRLIANGEGLNTTLQSTKDLNPGPYIVEVDAEVGRQSIRWIKSN